MPSGQWPVVGGVSLEPKILPPLHACLYCHCREVNQGKEPNHLFLGPILIDWQRSIPIVMAGGSPSLQPWENWPFPCDSTSPRVSHRGGTVGVRGRLSTRASFHWYNGWGRRCCLKVIPSPFLKSYKPPPPLFSFSSPRISGSQ